MSCPFSKTCPMFSALAFEERTKHLMWAFCYGEHTDCGRYKRMVAGEPVPEGMMPTGQLVGAGHQKQTF
jgi:hypothetical protein